MQFSWRRAEAALFPLSNEHSHTIKGEHTMQQPPNQWQAGPLNNYTERYNSQPPIYQPPPPQVPPKKKSRKKLWLLIGAAIVVLIIAANIGAHLSPSSTDTSPQATQPAQATQAPAQPTAAPTQAVQPTQAPTQQLAPLPSASDLNQLIDQRDGKATNVNVTKNADGTSNVAVDIQVNSPTQSRVEHIAYGLAQFFYGSRPDVGLINLVFHANGYTGMDDPIASCGGPAPSQWAGMDEGQLWNAMAGVFDANLPA
jgi:hypothetical protein